MYICAYTISIVIKMYVTKRTLAPIRENTFVEIQCLTICAAYVALPSSMSTCSPAMGGRCRNCK